MPLRKKRKSLFDDMEEMFESMGRGKGLEGGCSVSVTQTPEGTKVYAIARGDTDTSRLRRQLQQRYPGAEIVIEGGRPLIREISTRPVEPEEEKER